jgi:hypothetical protein
MIVARQLHWRPIVDVESTTSGGEDFLGRDIISEGRLP